MREPTAYHGRLRRLVLSLTAILCALSAAHAAEVSIALSSREVYVGMPFSLTITVREYENFGERDHPSIPEVAGLRVLGPPSQSTQSSYRNINGRITQSRTLELRYSLMATQAGEFTLPPLEVTVDGESFTGQPIEIIASKPEAGDLLFLEMEADDELVYLGEPVRLTLRIWIKRYDDEEFNVRLGPGDTWSLVSGQRSRFGLFENAIGRLERRSWQGAVGQSRRRAGADGEEAVYHVFEVDAVSRPQQAGPLNVEPVVLYLDYPTRLERSRDFFSAGRLRIADSRPVVAASEPPAVEVRLPPEEGRPPFYAGAVGAFDIEVVAKPTEAAVGDPITITLIVRDRTPSGAPLELLQPPVLQRVPELERDFRIPPDPLAGVVEGRRKTFTQTIRAKNEQVDQVPAIPFAYFDPEREEYVTVRSEPIPLDIRAASTLTMAEIVGGEASGAPRATELTEVAGGILANHVGADRLLTPQGLRVAWWHWALLAAPPALFAAAALGRYEVRRLRHDRGYARRRAALRNAMRRLRSARSESGSARAEAVAGALTGYVADRGNLPAGALTGAEAVAHLRSACAAPGLIDEVESLLAACEAMRYGGAEAAGDDAVADRAARCIRRLERERIG
ncbi:MAG: BatD family protein [Planctomycetota bacterium]|nr:BatD family protein [Planctomycetota bacterium]